MRAPFRTARVTRGLLSMHQISTTLTPAGGGSRLVPLTMMLVVGTLWGLTFSFAKAASDDGIGPLCLFVLAPLMYLQVPVLVFALLYFKLQLKPLVSGRLRRSAGSLPSGAWPRG